MPVRHVAQAQDRGNWPRTANGSSSWSATCYLIAVKTGKIRCETLLKAFPEGAKEKNIAGDLPLQQMAFSEPLVQTLSRIIWKGRHPLPRACLSDSLLHPLQEFAVRISCDHAAAVEFKLCIFSARNSEHHPLRHFVSAGYANAHARIESFLFPTTAVRRSMLRLCLP